MVLNKSSIHQVSNGAFELKREGENEKSEMIRNEFCD